MKKNKAITTPWGQAKSAYFNFDLIEAYYAYQEPAKAAYLLSDRTVQDLDMKAFFRFLDRTHSAVGQQYLYARLRRLDTTAEDLKVLENRIQHFQNNEKARLAAQKVLKHLSKGDDYFLPFLIYGELPPKLKFIQAVQVLKWVVPISIVFLLFYPYFLFPLLLFLLINTFLHYWHKKRIGDFVDIFSRLKKLSETSQKLLPHAGFSEKEQQHLQSSIKTVNQLTKKTNVLATHLLQNNDAAAVAWLIAEIFKIIALQEITTFHQVVDEIEAKREDIHALFKATGKVDMALSVASLRAGLPHYSQPHFTPPQKEIQLKELYHPLVDNCVANDLHLHHKSLLLTGSNMSGKSTFIKAINLNIITSQTLNTSFTQYYKAPIFNLATSIQIRDVITEGRSYYMEEVATIGELLSASKTQTPQFLFTIDEVFKGTNTIERISSAKAILEYLNRDDHMVLVSTHDIELTQLLGEGFDLYYFQESIDNQSLSFDYTLRQGALQKRNAINILEIAGYPASIVEEAQRLALQFENEKMGASNRL
ncbi:MAG: DNA mismatch repair protein MutS [Bacteroidota bacterium]